MTILSTYSIRLLFSEVFCMNKNIILKELVR